MVNLKRLNFRKHFWALTVLPLIVLSLVAIFTSLYFAADVSSKEAIMNKKDIGVTLLDRDGTAFFNLFEARQKTYIPLAEVPKSVIQAVIASEDQNFYSHNGFSFKGIFRSIFKDVQRGDTTFGGSTITQQLVKNSLLTSEKSFLRKFQEIILAEKIEAKYSKEEILEMYITSVYFGRGAFGIEEAAQTYFGKKAKDLSLAESTMLVAILPSPSRLSPFKDNGEAARERQKYVLQRMVDEGYLSSEEKDQALKEKLEFISPKDTMNTQAPHFAMMVQAELISLYGEEKVVRSGYKVKTTLNMGWQQFAQKVVANHVKTISSNRVSNGAAVVIDPKTGQVLVAVGSKDWFADGFGKVNIITSLRQPGSAFKPIVYAGALESGAITPSTVLKDRPTTYQANRWSKPYSPKNYDNTFRGPVLPRKALANSLNVPSVEVLSKLGVEKALDQAEEMGISSLKDRSRFGLSLVLGAGEVQPLELTAAYAVFASSGEYHKPTTILEIYDKQNKKIYQFESIGKQILDPKVAFLISSFLSDSRARQEVFGSVLNTKVEAAVKTGTTSDYKDSWTLGYTPDLAIGVWVGNNDGRPMNNIAGSLGAAPIFKSLMEKFQKGKAEFLPPSGVVALSVCQGSGLKALGETASYAYTEYYLAGSEPKGDCIIPTPTPIQSGPTPPPVTAPDQSQPTPTPGQTQPVNQGNGNSKKDKEDDETKEGMLLNLLTSL